jgi:hypothetical protein
MIYWSVRLEASVIFGLFSLDRVNALAKNAAQRITTRYPPVIANNPERTVSLGRIAEILQEAFSSVPQFHQEGPLGLLGRAKLRNIFKWELREIGYEEEFVDLAAKKLIERLTHRIG